MYNERHWIPAQPDKLRAHSGGFRLSRQRGSGLHIHSNDPRDTMLLHRHTDQLLRHFHRALVMRNEQELRLSRHALDHGAEALGVRVIQRRVHLIEKAERCGIELEDREHQRGCRQCFFAARQ